MAATIPAVGDNALCDVLLEDASPNDFVLRLYTAVSPAIGEGSTAGDFTEATFTGYSAATLTRATWGAPSSGAKIYPTVTFTCTGGSETILGAYITEASTGTLLAAQAFAAGRAMSSGATLDVDITATLS